MDHLELNENYTPPPKKKLERDVISVVEKMIIRLGGELKRVEFSNENYFPDFVALFSDKYYSCYIEFKREEKGTLSQGQALTIEGLRSAGNDVFVVSNNATIDNLEIFLKAKLNGELK